MRPSATAVHARYETLLPCVRGWAVSTEAAGHACTHTAMTLALHTSSCCPSCRHPCRPHAASPMQENPRQCWATSHSRLGVIRLIFTAADLTHSIIQTTQAQARLLSTLEACISACTVTYSTTASYSPRAGTAHARTFRPPSISPPLNTRTAAEPRLVEVLDEPQRVLLGDDVHAADAVLVRHAVHLRTPHTPPLTDVASTSTQHG